MKKLLIAIAFFTITTPIYSQTAAAWQQDLRHLQHLVHTRYTNLFHTISAERWDSAAEKLYRDIPSMDQLSVLTGFMKLVAMFHIGHTQVNTFGFHHAGQNNLTLSRYPFLLYWFSDGLYVIAAGKDYEQAVGGRVSRIGNMKTEDALEAIRPLVSYENEQGYRGNSPFYLAIPEFLQNCGIASSATSVPLVLTKDGREQTVVFKPYSGNNHGSATGLEIPADWISARKKGNTPLWQKEPSAYRYQEYLPESKTLYVRHSVTLNDGNKTIEAFFRNMVEFIDKNDVQRLVLDIRNNGGGNNYLNKNIINSIVMSRKINQKGKFFCILGRRTFSAAQNLTNELEKYTEVIFAGEPTSENVNFYGDTRTEVLPNSKLPLNLSWMWWQNMDPRDKRKATSPQLAMDMSFADYHNNNDPVLQLVLNYNDNRELIPGITNLLNKGKKEDAVRFAQNFQKDPVNRYISERLETNINDEGYRMMAGGNLQLASDLFEVNMTLFPESANTYDSFAESLMNLGKPDEAVKYYEKAIAKDKEGVTAENARKMISRIKEKKGF